MTRIRKFFDSKVIDAGWKTLKISLVGFWSRPRPRKTINLLWRINNWNGSRIKSMTFLYKCLHLIPKKLQPIFLQSTKNMFRKLPVIVFKMCTIITAYSKILQGSLSTQWKNTKRKRGMKSALSFFATTKIKHYLCFSFPQSHFLLFGNETLWRYICLCLNEFWFLLLSIWLLHLMIKDECF